MAEVHASLLKSALDVTKLFDLAGGLLPYDSKLVPETIWTQIYLT